MRRLDDTEVADLLDSDAVARLATIDADGYPHVTPIWFLWADGLIRLTSYADRPHLDRVRVDPRVGLVIDTEAAQRSDGERPNRQVRIIGDATVAVDIGGEWTRRIRRKYLGSAAEAPPSTGERAVITLRPRHFHAVASV
ncbi:pyridoxamine 5'-phosphate oxidase family protein [Mycobacterium sp. NPDC050551]|uniref:pyridoxamine 5'-phosphate oxidase family protein n=1 Tax=Mycobacterium sp. NPDC050551 TaxID=3155407 RepID=UPI0034170B61